MSSEEKPVGGERGGKPHKRKPQKRKPRRLKGSLREKVETRFHAALDGGEPAREIGILARAFVSLALIEGDSMVDLEAVTRAMAQEDEKIDAERASEVAEKVPG